MSMQKSMLLEILSPLPSTNDSDVTDQRRVGHHAIQIAADTIAYAFNVPLRLLLVDNLRDLPKTIHALLTQEATKQILLNEAPDLKESDYASLANDFYTAREWVLQLADPSQMQPVRPNLPKGWEQGMLMLLQHIERRVWLTEVSNPLPVYALCRMQEQWALYLLMWCSKQAETGGFFDIDTAAPSTVHQLPDMQHQPVQLDKVFDLPHLVLHRLNPFALPDNEGRATLCLPVVGPFFEPIDAERNSHYDAFRRKFNQFITRANKDVDWRAGALTPPNQEEIIDAFAARMDMSAAEAGNRSIQAHHALRMFLGATIQADLSLSRTTSEVSTMLIAWFARWHHYLERARQHTVLLGYHDSPRVVEAKYKESGWRLCIYKRKQYVEKTLTVEEILLSLCPQGDVCHIDNVDAFVNRLRERQNAAWSAQIMAINNLLNRHASVVTKPGENKPEEKQKFSNKAKNMLRGFGGRICRYLVGITRADTADVYWLDYGQTPPRLVHAGGYARMKEHRATAEHICKEFDQWAWREERVIVSPANESNVCPASLRANSPSQAYRVAATAQEEPQPIANKMGMAQKRKRVVIYKKGLELKKDESFAYFGGFPESSTPRDSMSQPLLVNGRVVGVMTFYGLIARQFDARLFIPIRRAATLIATCMYHQSQLMRMGELNSLFAQQDLMSFRQYSAHNQYNPLKNITKHLNNIFLCPVTHLWLRSKENPNRFELYGYNWPELFDDPSKPQSFIHDPQGGNSRHPSNCAFSALAIDLWHSEGNEHRGSFVQGHFDVAQDTKGYSAKEASSLGCTLGADILGESDGLNKFKPYRKKIFKDAPEGFALHDIMSFPLHRQYADSDEWEIVGIVTLHDWGYVYFDQEQPVSQPWDKGWRTVVKHMQTYLPYLLTQAEVLNNQLADARRFLIHAGRAELLAVLDSTRTLRARLSNSLAPDKGLRKVMDEVMADGFTGNYKERLQHAYSTLQQTWQAVEDAASPVWEQSLTQLANVMQEYRNMSTLGVDIAQSNELIDFKDEIDKILMSFKDRFWSQQVFVNNEIPREIQLRMPYLWFRILFNGLIHNAAKYATPDRAFDVKWDWEKRILTLQNVGFYRSDADIAEHLLAFGVRGSAASREESKYKAPDDGPIKRDGQGLGLWGAKLICGLLGIDMALHIRPEGVLKNLEHGVKQGKARYIVELYIPKVMTDRKARELPSNFC